MTNNVQSGGDVLEYMHREENKNQVANLFIFLPRIFEGGIFLETCFNYTDDCAYFSSSERRWINKIHKLKEKHPDEVEIIREAEDNDGCIYAKVPSTWMKLSPPRTYTDEQIAVMTARLNGQ